MNSTLFEECRGLDTLAVLAWIGSEKHRSRRHAWRCPTPGCDAAGDNLRVDVARYGMGARCFAGCGSMSNVDLTMAAHGCDHVEAARLLASTFGLAGGEAPTRDELARLRRRRDELASVARRWREKAQAPDLTEEQWERWGPHRLGALQHVWDHTELGPRGEAYLSSRALDPGMCRSLGVRSVEDEGAWRRLLGELGEELLLACGLGKRSKLGGVHPCFARAPMLVFGYFAGDGTRLEQLESLRFRPFGGAERPGAKYLSLRHRVNQPTLPFLHDAQAAAERLDVALCVTEGELNALSVMQAGGLAIAAQGATSWRPEWGLGMGRAHVLVLRDGDRAGMEFASSVVRALGASEHVYHVDGAATSLDLGQGRDANDWQKAGQLRRLLLEHGAAREDMYDGHAAMEVA